MNFANAKLAYAFSAVVLSLIVLSPLLAMTIPLPSGEQFSEMWVLGPNHMLNGYPFDILPDTTNKVYLGVGNHMGNLSYYQIMVKFRNESEPLPNGTMGLPSPLEPVFKYNVFLANNETWEREFSFSFEGVSFEGNVNRVSKILVDDYAADINKISVRDETRSGFYYELFFELWIYNVEDGVFQYHNRYCGIWLNMTSSSIS